MSQHTFNALDGKVLLTGYDRNCGEFYYSIYAGQAADSPLHSSVSDEGLNARDLKRIQARVVDLMPGAPESMWSSVMDDAMNDVGNRIVHWTSDGKIKFDSEALIATTA